MSRLLFCLSIFFAYTLYTGEVLSGYGAFSADHFSSVLTDNDFSADDTSDETDAGDPPVIMLSISSNLATSNGQFIGLHTKQNTVTRCSGNQLIRAPPPLIS